MQVTNRLLGRLSRIERTQLGTFRAPPEVKVPDAKAVQQLRDTVTALVEAIADEQEVAPEVLADLGQRIRRAAVPAGYPVAAGIAASFCRLFELAIPGGAVRRLITLHVQALSHVMQQDMTGESRAARDLLRKDAF